MFYIIYQFIIQLKTKTVNKNLTASFLRQKQTGEVTFTKEFPQEEGFPTTPSTTSSAWRQKDGCRQNTDMEKEGSIMFPRIGPLQDPVTWYRINYSGTSKTKKLVPVQPDFTLFWKSHCVICVPV